MVGVIKLNARVEEKSHQRPNYQNGPEIQVTDNTTPDTKQINNGRHVVQTFIMYKRVYHLGYL